MKIFAVIAKVLAALATVIGAIYLLATYGEQIVAWCKKIWERVNNLELCCSADVEAAPVEEEAEPAEEPAAEEPVIEEVPVEEVPVEEAPAEEAPVENEVVADEADFVE